jgi:AcrR family transcriptional regulator
LVTRKRLTAEQRRTLTREALIDAAAEVFGELGYDGASVEELADRAGFSKGAVYSNFESKEALFLALIERRYQTLLDSYAQLIDEAGGGTPSLSAVASVWRAAESNDPFTLRLMLEFRLQALRKPEIRERLAVFEQQTEQLIARFVTEQVERVGAELAVPAEEFAALLYASNQGILQHVAVCATPHPDLFEQFLELATNSAVRPVRTLAGATGIHDA